MALSLGIRKGSKLEIGASQIEVVGLSTPDYVEVKVGDKTFMVTSYERTEILPEVFVSMGSEDRSHGKFARLAIEAPQRVNIRRVGE